ncbi:hypothetical protein [Nocardioides currus]|uniref:hypothetical protein n=1 Tax=Nocardioides currus TaxID=2133958 RepID=UPI0010570D25|nr:hypothetical protein [Nocardioides currus]
MWTHLRGTRSAALVLVAVALTSCSNDSADGPDPDQSPASPSSSDTSTPSAGACDEVISASVIESLGWSSDTAAAEGLGGCSWEGPEGVVVVASESGSLDEACSTLEAIKPASGYQSSIEVPGGERACAYVRDGDVGLSQLALEAEDGRVIGVRVGPTTATSPDLVQDALVELAGAAPSVS